MKKSVNVENAIVKEEEQKEEKQQKLKKEKKIVYLKQWMVSGTTKSGKDVIEFYLATCGLKAREAYHSRNGKDSKIHLVMQTAESKLPSSWLDKNDAYQWTVDKNKLH